MTILVTLFSLPGMAWRDDDEVAGADAHLTVAAGSHAAQGAQRLALTAGGHQHHLFRRILVDLIDADEGAFRDVHIAQLLSHGGIVDHAAAAEGTLRPSSTASR